MANSNKKNEFSYKNVIKIALSDVFFDRPTHDMSNKEAQNTSFLRPFLKMHINNKNKTYITYNI